MFNTVILRYSNYYSQTMPTNWRFFVGVASVADWLSIMIKTVFLFRKPFNDESWSGTIGTCVILERPVLKILYTYTIGGTNLEIQYMMSVLSVQHVRRQRKHFRNMDIYLIMSQKLILGMFYVLTWLVLTLSNVKIRQKAIDIMGFNNDWSRNQMVRDARN